MNRGSDPRRQTTKTWTAPGARAVRWLCLCLFGSFVALSGAQNISVVSALLAYSYTDNQTGELIQASRSGLYGAGSVVVNGSGYLVHVRVEDGANHGCAPYVNGPTPDYWPWVALVRRGGCKFQKKVDMALSHNASAIVIYNHEPEKIGATVRDVFVIKTTTVATVFIQYADGMALVMLLDDGVEVYLTVIAGSQHFLHSFNDTIHNGGGPNRHTTVVLLTFVGFLIVGLVVVVVYAVRHAKYVHARNQATMAMSLQNTQQAQEMLLSGDNLVQQTQNQQSQPLLVQLQQQQQQQQSLQQQQHQHNQQSAQQLQQQSEHHPQQPQAPTQGPDVRVSEPLSDQHGQSQSIALLPD